MKYFKYKSHSLKLGKWDLLEYISSESVALNGGQRFSHHKPNSIRFKSFQNISVYFQDHYDIALLETQKLILVPSHDTSLFINDVHVRIVYVCKILLILIKKIYCYF